MKVKELKDIIAYLEDGGRKTLDNLCNVLDEAIV